MAYKNSKGNIVGTKLIKKKKLKNYKDQYYIGAKFYYIGKTKETLDRIVYYEGKILEKLDNEMFRVRFKCRNKYTSNDYFERIVPKSIIHF